MVLLIIFDGDQVNSGDGKLWWIGRDDFGQAILAGLRPGPLLLDELVAFESVGIIGPTINTLCV